MTAPPYAPGSVLSEVAVFPLPQVVLFPGALMPLHISDALVLEPVGTGWSREFVASLLSPPEKLLARAQPRRHERENIDL